MYEPIVSVCRTQLLSSTSQSQSCILPVSGIIVPYPLTSPETRDIKMISVHASMHLVRYYRYDTRVWLIWNDINGIEIK